ncbi:hypothetical protein [Pseudonocardia sp. DLS-67]
MPRRPPARVRALNRRRSRPTPIRGVPISTSRALDRLDRPRLTSLAINDELIVWGRVAQKPRAVLAREGNDWIRFVGPLARDPLEQAIRALPRRQRAPLRRRVARLDALFEEKTLNNPLADPALPWWSRRW